MTTTELPQFTRRHTLSIDALITRLQEQSNRIHDMVVPAYKMRITPEGLLEIDEPRLAGSGVYSTSLFELTRTFDAGVTSKLNIPGPYLTRMREHGLIGLLADNINAWLQREPNRVFLVRTYRSESDEPGIARALLSDSYGIRDNLPLLLAVLDGITDRGVDVDVTGELTERGMFVKFLAPTLTAEAPALLRNYRSPFSGERGADCPVVAAGGVLSNSELGFGASALFPQLQVRVCTNGMTVMEKGKAVFRNVHSGSQLQSGIVQVSQETFKRELELITSRVRDAVRTFLDIDYMVAKLNEITQRALTTVIDPQATIQHVGKQVGYTVSEMDRILAHFHRGGDYTAGGVLHAVTSAAQTLSDAEAGHSLERSSLRALTAAAAFQS